MINENEYDRYVRSVNEAMRKDEVSNARTLFFVLGLIVGLVVSSVFTYYYFLT
jgi:hypothetical protein